MYHPRVVLDTNVLCAALRSRRGASFKVVSLVGTGAFEIAVSVPLVLEYEDVLLRESQSAARRKLVENVLDYLCQVGRKQPIYFLWRPCLADPKDDMILELAVAAECELIVTHNLRDFGQSRQFGVEAISPAAFLSRLRDQT
jgi:putative PIN family toxin of toxin-antitoxin system